MYKIYTVYECQYNRDVETIGEAKLRDWWYDRGSAGDGSYVTPVSTEDKEEAKRWLRRHQDHLFWERHDRKSYSSYGRTYYIHECKPNAMKTVQLSKSEVKRVLGFMNRRGGISDEQARNFIERHGYGKDADKIIAQILYVENFGLDK
jgi:hypothetical protein